MTRPARATQQTATQSSSQADVPPSAVGGGGGDLQPFIWQQLADVQKSLGRIEATLDAQKESASKLSGKMDDAKKDIHGINLKLAWAAGAVVVALLVAGWVLSQMWDIAKPLLVKRLAESMSQVTPAPPGK